MIKEKFIPAITLIFVLLAICIVIASIIGNSNKITSATQPDYIAQLFNKNKVMNIDISIDQKQWELLLENATAEEFLPCDITINGETLKTVGIRAKGNSSLNQVARDENTDRFSFKLDFSEYIDGQNLYGLDRMVLNNMISDPTYMKEYLSYEMMNEMGVNTPAYSYANITINGQKWGLYLAVELLEEDFLTRYYGLEYGNLYKPEGMQMGRAQGEKSAPGNNPNMPNMPQGNKAEEQGKQPENMPPKDVQLGKDGIGNGNMLQGGMPKMGEGNSGTNLVYTDDNLSSYKGIFEDVITKSTTDADKKKVVQMIKDLNSGKNLEKNLDVDEILRYIAVNTFLVNLDSYAGSLKHNYYLYEQNGKFQILPWDYNLSFGSFQIKEGSKIINFPIDAPVTDTMENSPLISKLLEVDEYKKLYHGYLNELIESYITSGKYNSEITRLDSMISEYVQNDTTAFYSYDQYKKSLSELKIYGKDRVKSILAQLAGQQPTDAYGNVETSLNLASFGSMGGGKGVENDRNAGAFMVGGPDNQNMQEATEIVRSASGRELTEAELTKLKQLGIEESMLSQIKKINNMGMPLGMGDNNKISSSYVENACMLIPYVIAIILGIIFVMKFKKKYN